MKKMKSFFEKITLSFRLFFKKSRIKKPLYIKGNKFINIGSNVYIHEYARIECFSNYRPSIYIGNDVIIGYFFTCLSAEKIEIGDRTIIASNVSLISENHGSNPEIGCYYKQPLICDKIIIGTGCWIGQNVTILPGVLIGDNVIIGANSLVNKSIPSNSVAVGHPAKVIKIYDFKEKKWKKVGGMFHA